MTLAFYDKLSVSYNTEMGLVSMKVLWTLYQSLGGDSATRYHVYYYLVSLANKSLDQEHVQAVSTFAVHGTVPSSTSTVFLGAVKYLRTLKSLYSLMVSKTRADDYKIQIQRFRDQPEIFYLELTWFSKSPSPASPTLPCAGQTDFLVRQI